MKKNQIRVDIDIHVTIFVLKNRENKYDFEYRLMDDHITFSISDQSHFFA